MPAKAKISGLVVAGFPSPSRLWTERLETAEYYSWAGRALERVCLLHVREIKRALENRMRQKVGLLIIA